MSRGILGASEQLLEAGLACFIRHKRGLSEHVTARCTCLPPPSLESTISCFFSDFKPKSVLSSNYGSSFSYDYVDNLLIQPIEHFIIAGLL